MWFVIHAGVCAYSKLQRSIKKIFLINSIPIHTYGQGQRSIRFFFPFFMYALMPMCER